MGDRFRYAGRPQDRYADESESFRSGGSWGEGRWISGDFHEDDDGGEVYDSRDPWTTDDEEVEPP